MDRNNQSGRGARSPGGRFRGQSRSRGSFPRGRNRFEHKNELESPSESRIDRNNFNNPSGRGDRRPGGRFRGQDRSRGSFRGQDRSRGSFRGQDRSRGSFRGQDRSRGSFRGQDRSRGSFPRGRNRFEHKNEGDMEHSSEDGSRMNRNNFNYQSGRGDRRPGGRFRGQNRPRGSRGSFPRDKRKFEQENELDMEPSSEDENKNEEEEEDEDNYHRNKGKGGRKVYVMKYTKDFEEQESSSGSGSEESEEEAGYGNQESEEEAGYGNQPELEEREDYSEMPMEELLKLQEEIGTKAFNKQILKAKPQSKVKVEEKRQESPAKRKKADPLAMPLMRKTAHRMNSLDPKQRRKKEIIRDPRFDNLSGKLDLDTWREHYQFLDEMRKEEKKVLEKDLAGQNDEETKEKIKTILKRMENQEKQRAFRETESKIKMEIKSQQKEQLREGIKPQFLSKKEMHMKVKAKHFETLKKEHRLDKYMERKEKQLLSKERKNKRTV